MEIRAYAPDDLDAILQLFYDTVHTTCLGDYTQAQVDAWADGHPDRAAWARSLAGHYTLVALLDDVPAGFGDIDATGYLDRLYVRSDAQGRGVATALCARLEAHAAGKAVRLHYGIALLFAARLPACKAADRLPQGRCAEQFHLGKAVPCVETHISVYKPQVDGFGDVFPCGRHAFPAARRERGCARWQCLAPGRFP